ncbi:MAG: rRNA maturation RNase YbeY [Coprobacillus sp.]|nr:rRNA maturation RNase YbeY [Coprobacillus sp.]
MKLYFSTYAKDYKEYETLFQILLEKTMKHLGLKINPIVSIDLVDEDSIHELNLKYRGIDNSTDVLSFAYLDDNLERANILRSEDEVELGDICICVDVAKRNAPTYNYSLKRELCFLFVHGLLHLIGYTHEHDDMDNIMFRIQEEILEESEIDYDR